MTVKPKKVGKERKTKTKAPDEKKLKSTKITQDIFTDEIKLLQPRFDADYKDYLKIIWEENPELQELFKNAPDLETARDRMYTYLEQAERSVFAVDNDLHILEKATVRDSIKVFKSIIGPINESRTNFSALDTLRKVARGEKENNGQKISAGFLMEFIHLFRAVKGKSHIYRENDGVKKGVPKFLEMHGREAAHERMNSLDDLGGSVQKYFKKYPSGLDEEVITWRTANRKKIMSLFGASEADWNNYQWHLRNLVTDSKTILDVIELNSPDTEAVKKAVKNKIPFGITPYYLSLMDSKLSIGYDHAVRAQVLPPKNYVDQMVEHQKDLEEAFDFMGEHDTSPVDLVTRRYPIIAIIKPFNTCAQICVYCQRNWEITGVLDPKAQASRQTIKNALDWLDEHPSVGDVLITGGDPLVMKDNMIRYLLEEISKKKHVYRVRFGSRTPVVMPQRWTDSLMDIFKEFHNPPDLEIALVTHFEHSYEVTPEALEAVQKIRKAGISVYNQEVFTVENSRRFETAKLRRDLKSIGVDPYYTFNMKGKEETRRYMVPIARILQERKEEARLLPGLDRTDEPVFNVPRMGKNHLRAGQDHRIVMILPDGSRVYEFHPWEKNITAVPPYNYHDVPIYDYLEELAARGENILDYKTIWYYY